MNDENVRKLLALETELDATQAARAKFAPAAAAWEAYLAKARSAAKEAWMEALAAAEVWAAQAREWRAAALDAAADLAEELAAAAWDRAREALAAGAALWRAGCAARDAEDAEFATNGAPVPQNRQEGK